MYKTSSAGTFIGLAIVFLIVAFFATLWALNTLSAKFEGPDFYWYDVLAFWILAGAFKANVRKSN